MTESLRQQPTPAAWNVAALLLAVSDALTVRFGALVVQGELSGFSRATSGHCYFALKDAGGAPGLMRCAMFRRAATLIDFAPADGQRVQVRGRIAVYEPRGELQFVVESLQRLGAGNLYEEFLRLRARLAEQGLFDDSRKRAITAHPRAIGVVTSLGAAALHDVLSALARRASQVSVVIYPCLVQGADAPASIIAALETAGRRREVDTLLLVRGGGSIEDLWSFNDERVVRAVVACPLPVVCGVGHETDITLADLAADLRAATPTAAAELAAPERQALHADLVTLQRALRRGAERLLDRQAQRLDLIARRAGAPAQQWLGQVHRIDGLARRLSAAAGSHCQHAALALPGQAQRLTRAAAALFAPRHQRLDAAAARLRAAHPDQVLRRGFAWLQSDAGTPLTSAAALHAGDHFTAVLHDGRAQAVVDFVEPAAQCN